MPWDCSGQWSDYHHAANENLIYEPVDLFCLEDKVQFTGTLEVMIKAFD